MRHYQTLLLDSLRRSHWRLDEERPPDQWWAAALWVISSERAQAGRQLFVTFIVDPASDQAHSAVRDIAITTEPLSTWQSSGALVSLQPHRRSYPSDLEAAMLRLDEFRNQTSDG